MLLGGQTDYHKVIHRKKAVNGMEQEAYSENQIPANILIVDDEKVIL